MSADQIRVCSHALKDLFGDVVERIGSHLISHGPLTIAQITKALKLTKSEIKKCLLVLIQHQLVSYSTPKPNQVVYKLELVYLLQVVRHPRHVQSGREVGGEIGEFIIEDVLLHGQTTLTQCINRVIKRLGDSRDSTTPHRRDSILKTFESLIKQRYMYRVRSHSFDNTSSNQPIPLSERFIMPCIPVEQLVGRKRGRSPGKGDKSVAKKLRNTSDDEVDEDIKDTLWFLNIDQFHRYYRHQGIVQAVGEKIDPTSSIIIKMIIKASQEEERLDTPLYTPMGPPIYPLQILEHLPNTFTLSKEELDQYLTILVEEQFLSKTDEAGGGTYCINYKKCSERLCQAVVESVVRERFGSKPLRLFRLLLLKRHLEQKQLSDMALVPNKESKEMLYSLLAENFVSLQEIPKANDYTPSRTFYLFSVNKTDVARVVLQRCYKGLGNLLAKKDHEINVNKRLLEKYGTWEKQQGREGEGVVGEVDDIITPSEKEMAEKIKFNIEKLQQGELQLDYTIFVIEDYLGFLKK